MEDVKELKHLGHYYLNTYIKTTLRVENDKKHYNKMKRHAYHRLAQELRTDPYKCHFGNMNTSEEVMLAINVLKKWIEID